MEKSYGKGFTKGHEVKLCSCGTFLGSNTCQCKFSRQLTLIESHSKSWFVLSETIGNITPPGRALLGNSAFPKNHASVSGKIIRDLKQNEGNRSQSIVLNHDAAVTMLLNKVYQVRDNALCGISGQ